MLAFYRYLLPVKCVPFSVSKVSERYVDITNVETLPGRFINNRRTDGWMDRRRDGGIQNDKEKEGRTEGW